MKEKTTKINGPVNVIRLEGELSGVKKTVYLFGDVHMTEMEQTQCDDMFSLDFNKYLAYKFDSLKSNPKKNNIMYDLFFETTIQKEKTIATRKHNKDFYIADFNKFFAKNSKHLAKKFNINDDYHDSRFENVRFHFMDIRDNHPVNLNYSPYLFDFFSNTPVETVLHHWTVLYIKCDIKLEIINGLANQNRPDELQSLYEQLYKSEEISDFKYNLKKIISVKNKKALQFINTILENITNHLTSIIRRIYKMIDIIHELSYLYDIKTAYHLIKYKNIYNYKKFLNKLDIKYEYERLFDEITTNILNMHVCYTDLYMMRRFLDKSYIQHALVYTGLHHTCCYIFYLVKYFNFKITHAYYHAKPITKELHTKIKSVNDEEIIFKFDQHELLKELFFPPELIQCIDMKDFPNDFL
jgi:hypothetical protein